MYVRTYDTGLKDFPEDMLFDVQSDPHELVDLARARPEIVAQGKEILEAWYDQMLGTDPRASDPLDEVIREGGPYHTRDDVEHYARQHERSGHPEHAERMRREKGRPNR